MSDIAQHVRAIRRRLRLSQEDFAERCGIERVVVWQLENGRNKGTSAAIQTALARGAGMTLEELRRYLSRAAPASGAEPYRCPRTRKAA